MIYSVKNCWPYLKIFAHWCNILINGILDFSPHHCLLQSLFRKWFYFCFQEQRKRQKIYPVGLRIALPRDLIK